MKILFLFAVFTLFLLSFTTCTSCFVKADDSERNYEPQEIKTNRSKGANTFMECVERAFPNGAAQEAIIFSFVALILGITIFLGFFFGYRSSGGNGVNYTHVDFP